MKAIKLASIFAVSAVAAAVSTTTIAAEPVFSGTAGVSYLIKGEHNDADSRADTFSGTEDAELELAIDTGVVYLEIEMGGDANSDETINIGLEKAYVTQGAVQFGRFDGTLSDAAALGVNENSGVQLFSTTDTDDTGIRYSVSDELTVAIEASEAAELGNAANDHTNSDVGMALSFIADMGPGTFGFSGGALGDASAINVGYSMDVGSTTLAVSYGDGEKYTKGSSTALGVISDETSAAISAQLTPTDATTLNIEYVKNTSQSQVAGSTETETTGFYVYASYTAGDLDYYVEHYTNEVGDTTEIGVNASF